MFAIPLKGLRRNEDAMKSLAGIPLTFIGHSDFIFFPQKIPAFLRCLLKC